MNKKSKKRILYSCPCCGESTLPERPPGTFEICSICNWEDDLVQFNDIDYRGGANKISLREARAAYRDGLKKA